MEIQTTETTSTLRVMGAVAEDTGKYILTLTSELGSDSVSSSVTVEGKERKRHHM